MPQGWDLGVLWGFGGQFFSEIQPGLSCKFLKWMAHAPEPFSWVLAPWGLGEIPKGQISLNLNFKVNFKDFKPNFANLLTNERYTTYQPGFSFGLLGHTQEWDLGVPWGVWGSNFFPKIQPDLVCELHTWMIHAPAQLFGSLPPAALGRGQNLFFWTWSCGISNLKGWAVDQDTLKQN